MTVQYPVTSMIKPGHLDGQWDKLLGGVFTRWMLPPISDS